MWQSKPRLLPSGHLLLLFSQRTQFAATPTAKPSDCCRTSRVINIKFNLQLRRPKNAKSFPNFDRQQHVADTAATQKPENKATCSYWYCDCAADFCGSLVLLSSQVRRQQVRIFSSVIGCFCYCWFCCCQRRRRWWRYKSVGAGERLIKQATPSSLAARTREWSWSRRLISGRSFFRFLDKGGKQGPPSKLWYKNSIHFKQNSKLKCMKHQI